MGDLGELMDPSLSSPLTGGYLLIVLAEPRSEQHKEALLKRLSQGMLLSPVLDFDDCKFTKLGLITNRLVTSFPRIVSRFFWAPLVEGALLFCCTSTEN